MIIRAGVEADMTQCIELSKEFYKQTHYVEHVPLCEESCADWIRMSIEQGLIYVADAGDRLAGMIIGISSPFVMNRRFTACAELAWYVRPENRKSPAGLKLFFRFRKAAKAAGVKFLSMMNLENVDPDKVHKIYTGNGLIKAENTYLEVF